MQTRRKPCVYVIASEEQFKCLYIKKKYSKEMTVRRVDSPKVDANTIILENLEVAVLRDYLIILDETYLRFYVRGIHPPSIYRVDDIYKFPDAMDVILSDVVAAKKEEDEQVRSAIADFKERHKAIKASKPWMTAFFRRTNLSSNPTIEDILIDALHNKSSDSNKVAIEMEWLTKEGGLHPDAPYFVKEAYPDAKAKHESPNSTASSESVRPRN